MLAFWFDILLPICGLNVYAPSRKDVVYFFTLRFGRAFTKERLKSVPIL